MIPTVLFVLPAHAQNLVQNGSFEQGAFTNNGGGEESLLIGSTAMSNWTTTNAELAWLVNGSADRVTTPYGAYFLDLTGFHDASPYGGVTQTIVTTPGQSYYFSFSLGTNQINGQSGPVAATASVGSLSQSFIFTPPCQQHRQTFGYDFTATGSSTVVSIVGTQSDDGYYLGLDNVSVTPAAVPEASTTVSLGLLLGLGGVGLWRVKRRTATAL